MCTQCPGIHYQNPTTVVGCLVEEGDGVLLCRRSIEPRHGTWTLPAGFLELDEGLAAGARRETREEACLEVDVLAPHALLDMPHIGQGYVLFRARRAAGAAAAKPGHETLETAVFGLTEIPWGQLAFPAVHFALQLYQQDRRRLQARVHTGVLQWLGSGSGFEAESYELTEYMGVPILADGTEQADGTLGDATA